MLPASFYCLFLLSYRFLGLDHKLSQQFGAVYGNEFPQITMVTTWSTTHPVLDEIPTTGIPNIGRRRVPNIGGKGILNTGGQNFGGQARPPPRTQNPRRGVIDPQEHISLLEDQLRQMSRQMGIARRVKEKFKIVESHIQLTKIPQDPGIWMTKEKARLWARRNSSTLLWRIWRSS